MCDFRDIVWGIFWGRIYICRRGTPRPDTPVPRLDLLIVYYVIGLFFHILFISCVECVAKDRLCDILFLLLLSITHNIDGSYRNLLLLWCI